VRLWGLVGTRYGRNVMDRLDVERLVCFQTSLHACISLRTGQGILPLFYYMNLR